jgi:organic radical activating enzyme
MDFLTLYLSLRCTQACGHCLYGCSPEHGEHMSPEVFNQAIAAAESNKISRLNFFGGEPLLNPDFFTMLDSALEKHFSLILATNCRPLSNEQFLARFIEHTEQHKKSLVVVTANDDFHLKYFDPQKVITLLRDAGYQLVVNDYSNHTVAVTEYNAHNRELQKLNTAFSCCKARWTDYLGVLPDGKWTICPASLEPFGSVFSNEMADVIEFKRTLPMRYAAG